MHLLLIDPEAERLAAPLAALDVDVTPVATASAARAYLAGTAFDAVAVRDGLDGAADLADLASRLGVRLGVTTYTPAEAQDLGAALGPRLGVSPRSATDRVPPDVPPDAAREALVALRDEIGRVAHDLANPLAVVVGNAQLGLEMARALGADAALGEAFGDIEAAGRQLAEQTAALAALRARLDGLIGDG